MKVEKLPKPTPPLSIATILKAGFESAAKHWWLALLPALLDIFYWLGPRLSPHKLVEQAIDMLGSPLALAEMNRQLLVAAQQTNLFTSLTVPLIGVPTLMRLIPETTPIGTQTIEVASFGSWVALFVGLSMVGFLLTALYLSLIANTVKYAGNGRIPITKFLRRVLTTWLYLLLLGFALLLLTIVILFPLLIFGSLLSLISPTLLAFLLMTALMLAFWFAIFLGFTPHGLTFSNRPLPQALMESIQLVRLNYYSTVTLVLVIVGVTMVMDWLMRFADDGSWFTLSSILGHAFVSTALVTATYLFYRDRIAIQLVAERHSQPIEQIEETISNG